MHIFAKCLVVAGALFGASLIGTGAASAMPIAPDGGAHTSTAPIETVGWRCGPGWHINPWGRCVPNRRVYYGAPVYRPYGVYRPYYRRPYYGHPYYHRHYYHRRYW
ncbi:hypothetical protein K9U39_11535 [Rhodoblastus acidophilus]|uniref:Uncharacterized protein n=1 Tax=Candidatus Rhodoblastus alkanivorans TaxID=2954117 RepID=A0ABS9Z9E0_9HYPH|nr:hypothetical protein [Candidatus Rhodoblastus alkanivorans]MCI4680015.1 hypothetical protein [Candidatus Rhodoblastus alkanivorans]MCI4684243.1 hypothetical protein [Candidatus Rhodoblastus alkanivorans]MDI4641563.1 hypothetical protein [Rhodoblastus acidophilus]